MLCVMIWASIFGEFWYAGKKWGGKIAGLTCLPISKIISLTEGSKFRIEIQTFSLKGFDVGEVKPVLSKQILPFIDKQNQLA